jgi:hypothetical protein
MIDARGSDAVPTISFEISLFTLTKRGALVKVEPLLVLRLRPSYST